MQDWSNAIKFSKLLFKKTHHYPRTELIIIRLFLICKKPEYLHAIKRSATASDDAVAVGSKAALFWEWAVALGQKLTA